MSDEEYDFFRRPWATGYALLSTLTLKRVVTTVCVILFLVVTIGGPLNRGVDCYNRHGRVYKEHQEQAAECDELRKTGKYRSAEKACDDEHLAVLGKWPIRAGMECVSDHIVLQLAQSIEFFVDLVVKPTMLFFLITLFYVIYRYIPHQNPTTILNPGHMVRYIPILNAKKTEVVAEDPHLLPVKSATPPPNGMSSSVIIEQHPHDD